MALTRRAVDPAALTESVMRRLWSKTRIEPNGCIVWTGAKSPNGYGRIGFGPGRNDTAVTHRLSLIWALGSDIGNLDVDHLCRNRACIRPDHLEAVSRRENIKRSTSRGGETLREVERTGRCRRGHDVTQPGAWVHQDSGRMCRLCRNENALKRWHARRDAS